MVCNVFFFEILKCVKCIKCDQGDHGDQADWANMFIKKIQTETITTQVPTDLL